MRLPKGTQKGGPRETSLGKSSFLLFACGILEWHHRGRGRKHLQDWGKNRTEADLSSGPPLSLSEAVNDLGSKWGLAKDYRTKKKRDKT